MLGVLPSGSGATNHRPCHPGFHQPPGLCKSNRDAILSVSAFFSTLCGTLPPRKLRNGRLISYRLPRILYSCQGVFPKFYASFTQYARSVAFVRPPPRVKTRSGGSKPVLEQPTHDLSADGLWQLIPEDHDARVFIRRGMRFYVLLNLFLEILGALGAGGEHDARLDHLTP